ncbi:MAG: response regulator [Solirubrobacteraceae bacterium]
MSAASRVAICDDARAVKVYLRTVLEEGGDMDVVSTTSTGRDLLAELAGCDADVLLLDLLLPDVPEPAELVRRIRELSPATAILMMSNLPPAALEQEARGLAAEGWMPKEHDPVRLRDAVRAAIAAKP